MTARKHTPRYDAHTFASMGISADLEQQRRKRTIRERVAPTRADWWVFAWYTGVILVGAAVAVSIVGIIETALRLWTA